MAWTVKFTQDTDSQFIGTVFMSYIDDVDPTITFSKSTRYDSGDLSGFVQKAKAELATILSVTAKRREVAANLEAQLNK